MDHQSPDELLKDFVHVEFKRFVDADHFGNEAPHGETKSGYIIYNDHRQDFGMGTFRTSDDYTIDADVLEFVKSRHPDFIGYIDSTDGLYINGFWHAVDDENHLQH